MEWMKKLPPDKQQAVLDAQARRTEAVEKWDKGELTREEARKIVRECGEKIASICGCDM